MSKLGALLSLSIAASCLAALSLTTAAQAQVVYSNDFETNTAGFTSASTELLPTDSQPRAMGELISQLSASEKDFQ